MRFFQVTVLTVDGALDLRNFFEGRRRAEIGERASLSDSGVRNRPSESVKLFSRGIVVGRMALGMWMVLPVRRRELTH